MTVRLPVADRASTENHPQRTYPFRSPTAARGGYPSVDSQWEVLATLGATGSAVPAQLTDEGVDRQMTSIVDEIGPVTDPREMTATYVRAMNSGAVEAVLGLYTEDAVSVWEPGNPVSGKEHEDGLRAYLARKPSMKAELRESFVTDDTALLVVDWELDIPAGQGFEAEHHTGIGLDVLRLGEDGRWRYVVDNPFGEA